MDESLLLGLFTADGCGPVDAGAIEGLGIPGGHLMERAGAAVARESSSASSPSRPSSTPAKATTAATASSSRASSSTPASR